METTNISAGKAVCVILTYNCGSLLENTYKRIPAGAVVFTALPELLRVAPEIRSLIYGVLLFVIVLYLPRGMAAWFGRPAPRE